MHTLCIIMGKLTLENIISSDLDHLCVKHHSILHITHTHTYTTQTLFISIFIKLRALNRMRQIKRRARSTQSHMNREGVHGSHSIDHHFIFSFSHPFPSPPVSRICSSMSVSIVDDNLICATRECCCSRSGFGIDLFIW